MPSIDVAMERSLRRGLIDFVAVALRPVIERRGPIADAGNQISDVQKAFSSWDNCMAVAYCKWPVIAVIIVGGLIIFSIIWCIIRCACCGLSCCCSCFQCLKCCGNCCGCCDPPKGTPNKYLDDPYAAPTQPYKSHAPMATGVGDFRPRVAPAHEPPQYAEFDVSRKGGNEDALPAMPSWEQAGQKKVALEEEHEMENLQKPTPATGASASATALPVSPVSPIQPGPYGSSSVPGAVSPYMGASSNGMVQDPYSRNGPGYGTPEGYNQSTTSFGTGQGYGMAAAAVPRGPGSRSPAGYDNGGYGGYDNRQQGLPPPRGPGGSYDDYRRNGGTPQPLGYDMDRRSPRLPDLDRRSPHLPDLDRRSPRLPDLSMEGGYDQPPRRSPAPPQGGYGGPPAPAPYRRDPYGHNPRQYSSDSTRPLARPQGPSHEYSQGPPTSPGLQNSGGFDFNSGYSRPNTQGRDEYPEYNRPQQTSAAGGNASNGGGSAYPGYKAYQPDRQPQGWSGV